MDLNLHNKPLTQTHYIMSYDEWFSKSSRPHPKGSHQSLEDFRDYQLHVEQHSVSFQLEHQHRKDLELSRFKATDEMAQTRCYLDTSGTSFVFEPSPAKGIVQMTNQDITICFDGVLRMNKHQLQLMFQKQVVAIIRIKSDLKFNQIKSVLAKARI